MVLEFLLRHHERTGDPMSLSMVGTTCEAMARGGIYDQLAGGFARYSVDAGWVVPHFEKMLYDNALLLRVYLHWWRRTGSALAERIARETADFLLRDLQTPDGGFASALDADTDGVEGLTYVWTPAQLGDVLGTDAPAAEALFAVTREGTFEHGASTLQLPADPEDPARWMDMRRRLLAARRQRAQPARDDKVVTAWNGLAMAALAEAGVLLDRPVYLTAAVRCADLLIDRHLVDGRLRRVSRDGRVGEALGVAEDYGDLAEGLLALHQATGSADYLRAAGSLLDTAVERFGDGRGGFYDTADDAEALIQRPQDPTDNATPSGSSALAGALLTYCRAHRFARTPAVGASLLWESLRQSASSSPASSAGPLPWLRHWSRAGGGGYRRRTIAAPSAMLPGGCARPGRWWSVGNRMRQASRCWPIARRSTVGRLLTSAAAWCVMRP